MSDVPIELTDADIWAVNIAVALMMFGVALTLTTADFARVRDVPRAPVTGLLAQFVLLPALTSAAVWLLPIGPEVGLGMILLACCPGGTFSNVLTWIAKGSIGVSVTMTAISSLAATVLTPLNLALWAGINPTTRQVLDDVAVEPGEVLVLVVVVLFIPIAAGMLTARRFPDATRRADRFVRPISVTIFAVIIVLAVSKNLELLADTYTTLVPLVALHNAGALALGYLLARAVRLGEADRRAVTLEVGIQNSGLGLAIAFTFLPDLSDAILVLAMWGVWHLIGGMALALPWSRRTPEATPTTSPPAPQAA